MTKDDSLSALGRAVVLLILAGFPTTALASVAPTTLEKLVDRADLIVVARVVRVDDGPRNVGEDGQARVTKIATGDVLEVWKGTPGKTIRYRASPSWICDTSHAEPGEQVLLFLVRRQDSSILEIAHAGRGRMPYRDVRGTQYVTLWDDVELPLGTPMTRGPEPRYSFIRSVKVSVLRQLVTRVIPALRPSSLVTLVVVGLLVLGLVRRARRTSPRAD